MRRIAFVCLGNICRSPTAEGVFGDMILRNQRTGDYETGSYGVGGWHVGDPPDRRAQETALRHGIDLSALRAEQLSAYHADQWDLLLAMDTPVLHEMQRMMAGQNVDVELFGNVLPAHDPVYGRDVPDPYYNDGFENVFGMIERGCLALLQAVP